MNIMSFEENIQQWVQVDNQLKILNDKSRELREKKNMINNRIINYVEETNIRDSKIKITDGSLKFGYNKNQTPLSFKFIEQSLKEIIQNDDTVTQIINHLKNKRECKSTMEIKRYYNN